MIRELGVDEESMIASSKYQRGVQMLDFRSTPMTLARSVREACKNSLSLGHEVKSKSDGLQRACREEREKRVTEACDRAVSSGKLGSPVHLILLALRRRRWRAESD